jgi:hypothetical protein
MWKSQRLRMLYVMALMGLVSACAQLEVVAPNPRIEPPESRGEKSKWRIQAGAEAATLVKATEDAGARPPDMSDGDVTGHLGLYGGGAYAPWERVEIGLEGSPLSRGASLFVRSQLLGTGTAAAQEGNLPLSLYARVGRSQGENSGDQDGVFGPGNHPWKGTMSATFVHGGLSFGYRPSNIVLLYAGGAFGKYSFETEIEQEANQTDPAMTYKEKYDGTGLTAGAGALFSWRVVQFFVTMEYSKIEIKGLDEIDQLFVGSGIYITP